MFGAFPDQILPFDADAARAYADLAASRERTGIPIDGFDAQIAAVCRVHRVSLCTRNVRDFGATGLEMVDPWQRTASA